MDPAWDMGVDVVLVAVVVGLVVKAGLEAVVVVAPDPRERILGWWQQAKLTANSPWQQGQRAPSSAAGHTPQPLVACW